MGKQRLSRIALPFGIALLLCLAACVAPTTRGVGIDRSQVEKERQYQMQLSLQQQVKYQQQLDHVAWPILKAAVPLCDQSFQRRDLGFSVISLEDLPPQYVEPAKVVLNLSDAVQVISVAAGSPAAQAGVQVGDRLLALNGMPVARGKNAEKLFEEMRANVLQQDQPVRLRIERAGVPQELSVRAEMLCYFPTIATMGDEVNAYADGEHIVVSKGMLRFAENDLEISTVIAHELAHNIMRHMDAKKSNYWLGTLADIAAAAAGVNTQGTFGKMGATAYSQEFESEADYVGVYIQALAKQPIEHVAGFWRRMAAEHPGGIKENHGASHPSTPERFVAIERTVEEIRTKQRAGFPLIPDRK